nr:GNAT family N-acetyltransferase [Candidatus Sigynarchaeota archaeon]
MEIRGLKGSEFLSALYPLLEKSFVGSHESGVFFKLHAERPYDEPSWEYSRVGFIDGKMVAHVGIWRFTMLAHGIAFSCGGIRDVCTDPAFRKQKLGHQIL